jgi:hypothetical protein
MKNNTLFNLGIKYQTDKIVHHRYDRIYPMFLEGLRNSNIKLFEIGCGKDYASFKMWQEFFPEGRIFCMDIDEEFESDKSVVYRGDQTNRKDLERMVSLIGKCDIIIDDGSHVPQHQFDTFNFLFDKMLCEGGIYIIEDVYNLEEMKLYLESKKLPFKVFDFSKTHDKSSIIIEIPK